MKKYFSFFAVAAMISLAFSCTKPEPDDPTPVDPVDPTPKEEAINEITASLDGAGIKTTWADGDAVTVFAVTEDGDVTVKYVLSAGAGTANGTFKAEGTGVKTGASAYYASSVAGIDFASHNTFSYTLEAEQTAANPIFGSSTDGKAYKFVSPLAGIEIKLTGKGNAAKIAIEDKNTENIINGNVTFNAKTAKFSIKNGSASKNTVAKSFETVSLSETASSFFFEVPEGTLETGASIIVYNPANGMIGTAEIPAQDLKAGALTSISVELEAASSVADLSASESANCYMITEPGTYRFKTVRGNSPENVGASASAEILWETYGNMEEVTPNSIIAEVSYANDYVTFKTPETLKKGNALIAVKDAAGTILWSWHIWVIADQAIAETDLGYGDGTQLMNYNLGALGEPGTPESFGLVYQWGRKDPFVAGGSLGHSDVATVAGTAWTVTPEMAKVSSDFATQNPTVFVNVTGSDGCKDWLDPSDATRWSTTKGMHDPCPAGWRVPCADDSPTFFSTSLTITSSSYGEEDSDYTFTVNNSYKLPLGGSIAYGVDSETGEPNGYTKSDCKYFTCWAYGGDATGEYGDAIRIQKGGTPAYGVRRKGEACSVRCTKDVPAAE